MALSLEARSINEEAACILNEEAGYMSDESSSDGSSTFSDDNMYEIAEDLKTDTCFLAGLDALLMYPISDVRSNKWIEDQTLIAWGPENLYADKIGNRFPLVDTRLALHLGKVNYERYMRCQADRDSRENKGALLLAEELSGTMIAASKFHDSGIGTSLGQTISYAETTMSYTHENQSIRIPPLPEEAKTGSPFACVVCGCVVLIANNSEWK